MSEGMIWIIEPTIGPFPAQRQKSQTCSKVSFVAGYNPLFFALYYFGMMECTEIHLSWSRRISWVWFERCVLDCRAHCLAMAGQATIWIAVPMLHAMSEGMYDLDCRASDLILSG
ncbi:hypothetical protein IV203_027145 [Nitzschia inconspicua]|uniref:Uncharacterized protein n=1 Tax=Nitzschia inconspicua TaxID=303405 RepID=A0A9K3LJY9_9STRA|nr:hypothetical protein IV203_027145 [Nitzschia inconspicua]